MALDSENMVMPVSPLYGGNGSGFGGFGGDGWWIILLFILLGNGWGFGGFGGGAGMIGMMDGGFGGLYPWLNNSQHISDGFRDQQLGTQISGLQNSITSGFGDVQTSLCSGFAGVNATINSTHSALSNQLYTNQIADLERSYAAQTATAQGFNNVQAATSDLKYTVATENCADRAALSDGIRDLLAATQAQTQTILTQMCNDKIEQKNDTIAQLRSELMYARGQASQDVQTAQILAGQASEIDGVYNRLKNCPVGTYSVCNPYIYPNSQTCGCGCGVA